MTKKQRFVKDFKRDWQLHLLVLFPVVYMFIFDFIPMYGIQIAFRDFRPIPQVICRIDHRIDHLGQPTNNKNKRDNAKKREKYRHYERMLSGFEFHFPISFSFYGLIISSIFLFVNTFLSKFDKLFLKKKKSSLSSIPF